MWLKRKPTLVAQPATIACETCGHIVLESCASFVLVHGAKQWHCSTHRKPYDEYVHYPTAFYGGLGAVTHAYYRRMRVNGDGTPIGYTRRTGKPRAK